MANLKSKKSIRKHSSSQSTTQRSPKRRSALSISDVTKLRSAKAGTGAAVSRSPRTGGKVRDTASVKESEVEEYLCDRVNYYGGIHRKITSPSHIGCPDRLVVFPFGRVYLVELKRPKGGKLSHHQREWRKGFARVGVDIVYLNTKDEVDAWLGGVV